VQDKNKDHWTGWIQVLWCGRCGNAEAAAEATRHKSARLRATATLAIFPSPSRRRAEIPTPPFPVAAHRDSARFPRTRTAIESCQHRRSPVPSDRMLGSTIARLGGSSCSVLIYGIGVFARGEPGLEVHIGAGPAQVTLMESLIAGFLCFVYSWFVVLKMRAGKSFRWRDRISFLALVIASGAVFLRFAMPAFWGSDVGEQVRAAEAWSKVSVRMCAVALVLVFAGRSRFIVPLVVACLATAGFSVLSTIP
jgi:hypothetical protein